ncbi:hypothetical protein TIFTF001_023242 [Ficus carica]|uniref:Uncharacterized protein n=1 Tax=Ficus carica TaxID=3494 RepID=A0AA88AFT8_FICCA|nr:hypothetical protein TIFTF001_023242 [Ficus carica]
MEPKNAEAMNSGNGGGSGGSGDGGGGFGVGDQRPSAREPNCPSIGGLVLDLKPKPTESLILASRNSQY